MPTVLAALAADDAAIVVAIVAARLLVPLLIPRFPLVVLAALALDGFDNSLLERFTEVDLTADGPYQSWDKALDIYYLAIAYLSAMRNWTSNPAFRIAQFLFYYRLVGIVLFELLESRTLLLVFPNTFEFFFIAYELVRLRYDPARCTTRFWLVLAGALWIVVKLPQEYWIHVAQRDFGDTVSENPAVGVGAGVLVVAILAVFVFVIRPSLRAPDWRWRLKADPPPPRLGHPGVAWGDLAEKVALLALLCTVFAEILPRVGATPTQVTVAVAVIVAANAAISAVGARGAAGVEFTVARLGALLAANFALVYIASLVLSDEADFQLGAGLFFAFLVTLIVWLYDQFKPAYDARFTGPRAPA